MATPEVSCFFGAPLILLQSTDNVKPEEVKVEEKTEPLIAKEVDVQPPPEKKWHYVDPMGKQQGPFTTT